MINKLSLVKQLIKNAHYLSIAASDYAGEPSLAVVTYAVDSAYNFYWYSEKKAAHSEKIRENEHVELAISSMIMQENYTVYLKARAFEIIHNPELIKALSCYGKKSFVAQEVNREQVLLHRNYEEFQGESPLRMYVAIPEKVWLAIADNTNGIGHREEVNLLEE